MEFTINSGKWGIDTESDDFADVTTIFGVRESKQNRLLEFRCSQNSFQVTHRQATVDMALTAADITEISVDHSDNIVHLYCIVCCV